MWVLGLLMDGAAFITFEVLLYVVVITIIFGIPGYFINRWFWGKKPKPELKDDAWFQFKTPGEFRPSNSTVGVGIVLIVIFAWVMAHETTIPNEMVTLLERLVFWALFPVVGILVILYSVNKRIALKEDFFTYRNMWRRTQKVPYKSITQYGMRRFIKKGKYIHRSYGVYRICVGEKKYKFYVFTLAELEYLRGQLREKVGPEREKDLAAIP